MTQTGQQGAGPDAAERIPIFVNGGPTLVGVFARLDRERVLERIRARDHTVWKPDPTEISNRLGWLDVATRVRADLPNITPVVDAVRKDGYTQALLLGMGGSSLAPEVFRTTFGVARGYLDLAVLDSTDPEAVLAAAKRVDPAKTLFIVSTKSGGTVETFSFFRYFYHLTEQKLGKGKAGPHFIAITDPGSALADTAAKYNFRHCFLNDPNIGGRYSALSHFGIVPAALVGIDVPKLLDRAIAMSASADAGARLGAAMGELQSQGRDKITFILSPALSAFGNWVEQLIAESTGKEGKGILPVAGETVGAPSVYSKDRFFAYLRVAGDTTHDAAVTTLAEAGHAVVKIELADAYDLGGEFWRWEMATAIAGWAMKINPFDQPNVESAKILARKMVKAYETEGKLPALEATLRAGGITAYGDKKEATLAATVAGFMGKITAGDYVCLQAYVQPTTATTEALQQMRLRIRDHFKVATTVGYGPRFLHSTGQLHKGDGGNGLFIQLVSNPPAEVPIPDAPDADKSSMSFGVLKQAQALGDRQALVDNKRRVIRFDVTKVDEDIRALAQLIP